MSTGGFTDNLFIALQRLVPHHGLSRLAGLLASARPAWIRKPLITLFCRAYSVDLSEAARTEPDDYRHFNDFFTRELKADARPLAEGSAAICPADGAISQTGRITSGHLLQAKGHSYSLEALLGESSANLTDRFEGGAFATIYLAPWDYHRVHLPVAGNLRRTVAIPGALYSVNGRTEAHIDGLFARNERLVCHFDTDVGAMVVVLVGAMIVAGIETVWDGPHSPYARVEATEHRDVTLVRGAELGRFFLGSTVIVCMEPGRAELAEGLQPGGIVRMGQALFSLNSSA